MTNLLARVAEHTEIFFSQAKILRWTSLVKDVQLESDHFGVSAIDVFACRFRDITSLA